MPVNITDADTWTATIQAPADGDAVSSASAKIGVQGLANRSLYIASRVPGAAQGGVWVPINPLAGVASSSGTGTWLSGGTWINSAHGTKTVGFGFACPHGGTIQSIRAWITPAGSHAGLPATMPQITAAFYNLQTGSATSPAVQADTSASVGAYEAHHAITLTLPSPIQLLPGVGKTGVVSFAGEDSTNANDNLVLYGIELLVEPD